MYTHTHTHTCTHNYTLMQLVLSMDNAVETCKYMDMHCMHAKMTSWEGGTRHEESVSL